MKIKRTRTTTIETVSVTVIRSTDDTVPAVNGQADSPVSDDRVKAPFIAAREFDRELAGEAEESVAAVPTRSEIGHDYVALKDTCLSSSPAQTAISLEKLQGDSK